MSDATHQLPAGAFLRTFREPLLAEILRYRILCLFLAGLALIQILTAARQITFVFCPFAKLLGIPCPGCGLTRATVYLSAGHFRQALIQHAFSPVVLVGLLLMLAGAVAPMPWRNALCRAVAAVERCTALMPMLFLLLMVYWITRLILAPGVALEPLHL